MQWCWLLVLLPGVCLARIVQIDDLVKQDKGCAEGTVIHETGGHILEPDRMVPSERYREEAIFRYRFAGFVKEGAKQYLKISVHNLLFEKLVSANRSAQHNTRGGSVRPNAIAQAKEIELLVPLADGRAVFQFPSHVVTPSTEGRMEVMESLLELLKGRLKVVEVAHKMYPANKLPWIPPNHWPNDTQTIYLGRESDNPDTEPK